VVIHDVDASRPVIGPNETKSELIIDTNAMLALPVALERFETVAGRGSAAQWPRGLMQFLLSAFRFL
jgi:hypothetical protein